MIESEYHVIESESAEPVLMTFSWHIDPTGTTPEFKVTEPDVDGPGANDWVDGSWHDSWSLKTKRVSALSPTVGASGALIVAGGNDYTLWMRSGTIIKRNIRTLRIL